MHLKRDDKNASCVDGARALKCLWVGCVLQTDAQPSANVGADGERAWTRFKRLVPLLSRLIMLNQWQRPLVSAGEEKRAKEEKASRVRRCGICDFSR